jgi:hypothetical protein
MDSYASAKIKEALARAGGNATQAHRLLIALANDDDRFLRGLAGPFINGIIAHAIQRSGGGKVMPEPVKPKQPVKLTPAAMDKILARLGSRATPEVAAKAPEPVLANPTSVREAIEARKTDIQTRATASSDHSGSLKILAQAFKKKT